MYVRLRSWLNSLSVRVLASLCIFFCVFFTSLDSSPNKYGGTYVHNPDTPSYFMLPWNPWTSIRTPGYALFLYPFLEPHRAQLETVMKEARKLPFSEVFSWGKRFPEFVNAGGLQSVFDNVVLFQRLFLSLGAAFLVYTCSIFFNPLMVGVCFFLATRITPLVNPALLLTESVAQPLSFFALGFLLIFFKKRNFFFLFSASLSASMLYLVRPAGIYMLGLCGIAWLCFFRKERFRQRYGFFLAATGFLPAAAYIVYISATAGYLIFGTHPEGSDLQFSCYFLQKEDIANMPTVRSREYARIYLEKIDAWKMENGKRLFGPNFDEWPKTRSIGYRYSRTAWPLAFYPKYAVLAELAKNPEIGPLSLLDRVRVGRELQIGVLKRHRGDFIRTVTRNILTGVGYYRDYKSSSLWAYGFPRIVAAWGVWVCALLCCPRARFCLLLLGGAHLFHLLAVSYGNFIDPRYMNLTEVLFVFGVFLSLWSLVDRAMELSGKYLRRGQEGARL